MKVYGLATGAALLAAGFLGGRGRYSAAAAFLAAAGTIWAVGNRRAVPTWCLLPLPSAARLLEAAP